MDPQSGQHRSSGQCCFSNHFSAASSSGKRRNNWTMVSPSLWCFPGALRFFRSFIMARILPDTYDTFWLVWYIIPYGISKKAVRHRKRIRTHPELARMSFVIFMDGRAYDRAEGRYEFFELEAALINDYKWRPETPDAVVIVGTWGVPPRTDTSVLEKLAEHSGDVMFNPCSYAPGRSYPICLNPLLLNRRMIRLWRVGTHLISAG